MILKSKVTSDHNNQLNVEEWRCEVAENGNHSK